MASVALSFDSKYVNALRQGDPAVEAHFVDHFSPILLRTLQRKVRSADQAREIRQETFLRVLTTLRCGPGVNKPERFEPFVISVCKNILREAYREQCRSVALCDLESEPVADFPCAYTVALAKEAWNQARQRLSDVRVQCILEAMFLNGQSKDEICQQLGISRGYLRVLLCRAKKRLDGANCEAIPDQGTDAA